MKDATPVFSSLERNNLEKLRDLRIAGAWPKPVQDSFAHRHGVAMTLGLVVKGNDRQIYRCVLYRPEAGGISQVDILFQVTAQHPAPPDADEVLRWLASSVLCLADGDDLDVWAQLHGRSADGRRGPAYRGIIRDAATVDDFVGLVTRETNLLCALLGLDTYADLLAESQRA